MDTVKVIMSADPQAVFKSREGHLTKDVRNTSKIDARICPNCGGWIATCSCDFEDQ